MTKLICLILSLSLSGCITIVNVPPPINPPLPKGPETITTCDRFIIPQLPDLPKIPDLSDYTLKDRHLVEDALIQIISEHRNAIKKTKKVLNEAYIEYDLKCRSK